MLDRVRADLKTVENLQNEFAATNQKPAIPAAYPTTKLQEFTASKVRMISIEARSVSVVLDDSQTFRIDYPSSEALSNDLQEWSQHAPPEHLSRLNLPP